MDPEFGLAVPQRRDQLTFDAFCETHEQAWLAAARACRLSDEQAHAVVDAVRDWLWGDWQMLLREPAPAASAWKVLKDEIARAGTAATACGDDHGDHDDQGQWRTAIRTAMHRMHMEFTPDVPGAYEAILSLPERQQDVIILRYALDLRDETVAEYLDSTVVTVRSNARHAENRLKEKLTRRNP
ncbi:RNA polymerase sigma factor [Kitasatospora sp. NPDC092948]|uniref:RNA polymerase sigma factor n=1 Tax=Kitasatospora sp. NPDC092948 TaxID=3364088 RepID=UPI00380D3B05